MVEEENIKYSPQVTEGVVKKFSFLLSMLSSLRWNADKRSKKFADPNLVLSSKGKKNAEKRMNR